MEKWFCVEKEKRPGGESKPRSPACPAGILTNIPPWTHILDLKSPTERAHPFCLTLFNIYSFLNRKTPWRGMENVFSCGIQQICICTIPLFTFAGSCQLYKAHASHHSVFSHRTNHKSSLYPPTQPAQAIIRTNNAFKKSYCTDF